MKFIYVGLGGIAGATLRFLLGKYFAKFSGFPWGTLVINVSGSFVLSILFYYFKDPGSLGSINQNLYLALTTGMLGAYTTFSTFALEAFNLLEEARPCAAAAYIGGNICLGLIGILAGKLIILAI